MAARTNVVCISRAAAAGGEPIGWAVAERLGFHYVDDEILQLAADRAGIDPAIIAEAEVQKSVVMRVLDAIDALGSTKPAGWRGRPGLRTARGLIRDAIVTIAERGTAVIVAHAASMALGSRTGILRVLVTGSRDARANRLVDEGILSESEANATIDESDRSRQEYIERFYGVRDEGPAHYDLVINTDHVEIEQAVAAIVAAARP